MDMRMTESAAWMVGLMGFLVVMMVAVMVAVRVYGSRAARGDHPHAPLVVQRALVAGLAAPAVSALERGGDAVEDVGLRDHQ